MFTLIAMIGIVLGSVLMLLGLLLIAPQVRVHKIKVNSPGGWVFVAGALSVHFGQLALWFGDRLPVLAQVALVMGVLGLLSAALVGHHEQKQALENGAVRWFWQGSLMVRMLVAAILILPALLYLFTR